MNIDAAPSPDQVRDLTVIMSGCLSRPTSGYLFCKLAEGVDPTQIKVRLFAPKETCNRESCFKFQFLRRDGTPGFSGAIKKGDTFTDIALSDILGFGAALAAADAGEYQVMIRLWWIDPVEQVERTTRSDGLLRLWITAKEAQPFACLDPQIGWQIKLADECRADVSTSFRVALCGDGCGN